MQQVMTGKGYRKLAAVADKDENPCVVMFVFLYCLNFPASYIFPGILALLCRVYCQIWYHNDNKNTIYASALNYSKNIAKV